MTKKIIAVLCLATVLVGVFAVTGTQAQASENEYLVGYARVDINPYVVDGDIASGIMALPLRGSGDVWNRLSTDGLLDDNGDGDVTEEDGLAVTCIAVTDGTGKTVLIITIDLIGGVMLSKVRNEICTRVEAALANGEIEGVVLTDDQIYYAGTHTHNAPDVTVYNANGKVGTNDAGVDLSIINQNLGIWIERTLVDIGDAALLALKDRAPAKLIKDEISVDEAQSAVVKGKVMNSVRHYYNEADGCVAGDNFNTRGSDPKQVTQVNDTMYLLQFDYTDYNTRSGDNKLNIILANWRGHPSLNNNASYYGSRNCISSDYVNAFRHALEFPCAINSTATSWTYSEEQLYRVAFFNGEGGNVNPRGQEKIDGVRACAWIDNLATTNQECRGNGYGRVLAAMAKEGIRTTAHQESVTLNNIRTCQYVYNSTRKDTGITALAYEAAKAYRAEASPTHPYIYTSDAGEIYVIGSKFHASNIISYWDEDIQLPKDDIVDMELNVFMLGENLAFVTVPGEPFDYYYNEDGSNAWNNLVGEVYGTPFVFGYCNGAKGYVPNNKAYDYNLDSEKWQRGSYESSISPYAQGTGEHMIELFGEMLDVLVSGTTLARDVMCQHCKQVVTWEHYNGESTLRTGHYYLMEDLHSKQIHIESGAQVCFDLNGHTYEGETRAFYTEENGGSTLSVMDSSAEQTGKLMGSGGILGAVKGFNGATLIVDAGNTFNLYSGTLTACQRGVRSVSSGGVIRSKGTINMYGGVITGGVAYLFEGSYLSSGVPTEYKREGFGAAIYSDGVFNMYGGSVDSGEIKLITGVVSGSEDTGYTYTQTMQPGVGKATCIWTNSLVTVGANAVIGDIYFSSSSADLLYIDTADTPFTGSVQLTYEHVLQDPEDIGNCTAGTVLQNGAIVISGSDLSLVVQDADLYATGCTAAIINVNGEYVYCANIQAALEQYTYSEETPNYIRLLADVGGDITIEKDVYLDLYGHTIAGNLNVAQSATLYCMDSETDDYTIEDGVCGKITAAIRGNVQPVPMNTVSAAENGRRFGYMTIQDNDCLSFHRIKVLVSSLNLRPRNVGLYYTATFAGDAAISKTVKEYGIALNAYEVPNSENIVVGGSSLCVSSNEPWDISQQVVGGMLVGIMKETNSTQRNISNSERVIYCRAYVKTEDGYFFGEAVQYSLKDLVEIADETDAIQGETFTEVCEMYALYEDVMEHWNLPRLRQNMGLED